MVYLKDLQQQWPWMPNHKDLSDKEIYTHTISVEDASALWRVPIHPPMNGYAYVGMRVVTYGKDDNYTVTPRLVLGYTEQGMFGLPWDNTIASNGAWAPLGFPLTHKIIAICEDGLDSIIQHATPCWGQVEFVAQRFDDILEDETDISYIFLNHRTDKVEWILNPNNMMYKPNPYDYPVYPRKTKIMPSIRRLFDTKRNPWEDTALFWNHVNLPVPLLQ